MKNKKNYLLLVVDKDLQEEIIKNFGPPKINIYLNQFNKKIANCENFNQIDLLYNNYDYELLSSLPPLDAKLLKELSPYLHLYFRTCSRRNQNNAFLSHEEIIDSYYDHLKYWNWKLDHLKIRHLFAYSIPHEGADLIIYCLCKLKGINTYSTYRLPIIPNIISKRYFVKNILKHSNEKFNKNHNYFGDEKIDPEKLELSFKRLYFYYYPKISKTNLILEKDRQYRIAKIEKVSLLKKIKILYSSLLKSGLILTTKKILNKNLFFQKLIYRNPFLTSDIVLNKYYQSRIIKDTPNSPFIFLALHFQPELSSDILGDFFNNQNLVVDILAWVGKKFNVDIIIKRHPRKDERFFLRPKNFYQKMNAHENVYFISPNFSTDKLIERSIATASITGSVCWESFLKGKPSILFGSVIFENAPGTFKIKTKNDLEIALNKILNNKANFTKMDILNYLKYLERSTFDCSHKKLINAAPFSMKVSNKNFIINLKKFSKNF